jgi:transcriptional regulator with XRE-family HTH domain
MITLQELSTRFKELREENNFFQSQICESTGLNQSTLSNLESGKNFTIDVFLKLYNYYSELLSEPVVLGFLFNVNDPFSAIIVQKLKIYASRQNIELQNIIKHIE